MTHEAIEHRQEVAAGFAKRGKSAISAGCAAWDSAIVAQSARSIGSTTDETSTDDVEGTSESLSSSGLETTNDDRPHILVFSLSSTIACATAYTVRFASASIGAATTYCSSP
ncbi:hypothetical protein [Bradyrhizobium japonicum]|uniref:hypothetical protein n=1 Tax=Bradyrhizobium japonicum TaxID=375 RepID=UPI0012BC5564|nr:hypothetical protein [Bradyrhizobium japonicum]